jgi:methylenetetrahydrofolate dehydrogenase (NADP+)/methenyltetrahydrofolate cyclohydrolase
MGEILDGRFISNKRKEKILAEVKTLIKKDRSPKLAVLLIGDNPSSKSYVNMLLKQFSKVLIETELIQYDVEVEEQIVLDKINELNNDSNIDGILVQTPLPKHLDKEKIIQLINYKKDVDGFHLYNSGRLYSGDKNSFIPCTANSIITILDEYKIPVEGKNVVVIGRSNIVGKPVGLLLLSKNATVTFAHSKTNNLNELTKTADILVVAVGRAKMITKDMIKENAIVIDAGINLYNNSIVGDVDTDDVIDKCSFITPVPGGVGPVTVVKLMENTIKAYKDN